MTFVCGGVQALLVRGAVLPAGVELGCASPLGLENRWAANGFLAGFGLVPVSSGVRGGRNDPNLVASTVLLKWKI